MGHDDQLRPHHSHAESDWKYVPEYCCQHHQPDYPYYLSFPNRGYEQCGFQNGQRQDLYYALVTRDDRTPHRNAHKFCVERYMIPRSDLYFSGILFFTTLIGSALIALSVEEPEKWVAPAAEAQKKSPVPVNQSSLAVGQKVYLQRCAGCHGKAGNGDGPDAADLGIHPAKLSDPATREQTDGELFWKVTVGKKPMPSYRSRLSPTDRWSVINYLRTLARR